MADGAFIRVYYEDLMKSHADVWFDMAALFTFNHLLALADKLWPTPAELPRKLSKVGLEKCVGSGLITLRGGFTFEVKGLDAMRLARQRQTQPARDSLAGQRGATDAVTEPVTDSVDPPALARMRSGRVGSSSSLPKENGTLRAQVGETPEFPVLAWLAKAKAGRQPVGKVHLDLLDLVERNGADRVIAAMEELGPGLDTAQYVYGARNSLHPIPSARRQTETERKEAERRDVVERARRGELHVIPS